MTGRKRFYKQVGIITMDSGSGFQVTLDGKTLRTPARRPLVLPNLELSLALASEWDAQLDPRKGLEPATMPITQLVFTAIDQIEIAPGPTRRVCLSYLPTDTALFFASGDERTLLGKQKQHLQPLLRWMQRTFGVELSTSQGTFAGRLQHPQESLDKVDFIVSQLDPMALAVLQSVTMECKSLVMALAYVFRQISMQQLKVVSRLEEEFQVEVWGVVEGGHDMDRLNNSIALAAADTLIRLHWRAEDFRRVLHACKR